MEIKLVRVFHMCVLRVLSRLEAKSHWLHLCWEFSPLPGWLHSVERSRVGRRRVK